MWQLLQDVQERLVFRAHLYLQTDILQYSPAPGDLAYPEKLEMMEVIMCYFSNLTFIFDLVFLKCVYKVVSTIVLSKNLNYTFILFMNFLHGSFFLKKKRS